MNTVVHAGRSDRGQVRSGNEDRWFADPAQQLYLVTDGIGGHSAGALASRAVAEVLPRRLKKVLSETEDFADPAVIDAVVAAVSRFSREIRDESDVYPETKGMGATVVFAVIRTTHALVVHMGDSRAYLMRGGQLRRITEDHTVAQRLIDNGRLSREEAIQHPGRARLTRYVGTTNQASPDARLLELRPRDRILLCTDGLTGMLDDAQLQAILSEEDDLDTACRRMIELANDAGGQDNITVLVVAPDVAPC